MSRLEPIRVPRHQQEQGRDRKTARQRDEAAAQRRPAGARGVALPAGFGRELLPSIGGRVAILPGRRLACQPRPGPVSGIDGQARVIPGGDGFPISRCAFDRVAHMADASWSAAWLALANQVTGEFDPADANEDVRMETSARASTAPSPVSS
ncbi:MAG: hypothetical protein DI537_27400 [Stutzerimonas stutzeri]|nr:MAG: hypothetical protein DI537_27400 [Stutzerimonas stutzeri]